MMSFGSKYKWNIVKSINAKENIKDCELRRTHYETILQTMTLGYTGMNDWVKCDIFDEPNDKDWNMYIMFSLYPFSSNKNCCFDNSIANSIAQQLLVRQFEWLFYLSLHDCTMKSCTSLPAVTFSTVKKKYFLVTAYFLSSPFLSFLFFSLLSLLYSFPLNTINFIWWLQTYICNLLDWNESHTHAQCCWKNRELAMLFHRMQSEKNSFITVLEF